MLADRRTRKLLRNQSLTRSQWNVKYTNATHVKWKVAVLLNQPLFTCQTLGVNKKQSLDEYVMLLEQMSR